MKVDYGTDGLTLDVRDARPAWRLYYSLDGGQMGGIQYSRGAIPLWPPFVLVAAPTVYLWHRDRRRFAPGPCQRCGYSLTGNATGVCPECGAHAPSPGPAGV